MKDNQYFLKTFLCIFLFIIKQNFYQKYINNINNDDYNMNYILNLYMVENNINYYLK